jgi:nicotinate-nucleotide adenylyltransferase
MTKEKHHMSKKVGILGAAFNPPSIGHKDLIKQALSHVDEVWLVPSYKHAFSKEMLPYEVRCELLVDFASDIGIDAVIPMPLEHLIYSGGAVYTWDLLNYIESIKQPGDEIIFLMGPDNKDGWSRFYRSDDIMARWELFVAKEVKQVRSTMIRNAVASGSPYREMVTQRVGEKIEKLGLYRDSGNI